MNYELKMFKKDFVLQKCLCEYVFIRVAWKTEKRYKDAYT